MSPGQGAAARIKDQVDDLGVLISILPKPLSSWLSKHPQLQELNEIVLDLGYLPEVRFSDSSEVVEVCNEVTLVDINDVVQKLGTFNTDNRAGIERTLHRISAIRNREGKIIGLTCRVGRAVVGTIEIIRDIIESGKNVMFVGPPGIGKTTKLREVARVLSDEFHKRVMVVDTSNEIAGDGDIPHAGIGSARRIQVPSPDKQHAVMIEAVENHMPQVIIVDEIGTEEEAQAARTIAQRGVQLVATAHGHNLENLMKNPTLSDLVGGIQSVILGDEEAKIRGTQKTVLERKLPPTFECLIEIQERDIFAIYSDVAKAVDKALRGNWISPEIRHRQDDGTVIIESGSHPLSSKDNLEDLFLEKSEVDRKNDPEKMTLIYVFGVPINGILATISAMGISARITDAIEDADFVLTTKAKVKTRAKINQMLKGKSTPLHILRNATEPVIQKFLRDYFHVPDELDSLVQEALEEIRFLCNKANKSGHSQDASARSAYLRRVQHQEAEALGCHSMSVGEEPNRRVRVYAKG